jgi:hypothetical protein
MKRASPVLTALPTDDINAVVIAPLGVFQHRLCRHTPPTSAQAWVCGDVGVFFSNTMDLDCRTKIE